MLYLLLQSLNFRSISQPVHWIACRWSSMLDSSILQTTKSINLSYIQLNSIIDQNQPATCVQLTRINETFEVFDEFEY